MAAWGGKLGRSRSLPERADTDYVVELVNGDDDRDFKLLELVATAVVEGPPVGQGLGTAGSGEAVALERQRLGSRPHVVD